MLTLGVDLGTTYSAAAIADAAGVRLFELSQERSAMPTVVLVREDGTALLGEAAERRAVEAPGRLGREFKRRLGDQTPLVLGGTPFGAETLTGMVLGEIVARVTRTEGRGPDRVVMTHPATYTEFKLDLLRQAARLAGIGSVRFVAEPVAAAVHYAALERIEVGDVVAVYDFGGGTFDAAVLRRTAEGFELIGTPEGLERLGGIDLDEAVFARVLDAVGRPTPSTDDDPALGRALARLRTECRLAKEALSHDSDTTIPVVLPGVHTDVRITRTELEDMVRPRIRETIATLHRAVRSAGLDWPDVSRILLVGGTSRIPLIAEILRTETGRPVALDAHPKHAVALGAAAVGSAEPAPGAAPVPSERVAVSPSAQRPPSREPTGGPAWFRRFHPSVWIGGAAVAAAIGVIAIVATGGGVGDGADESAATSPVSTAGEVAGSNTTVGQEAVAAGETTVTNGGPAGELLSGHLLADPDANAGAMVVGFSDGEADTATGDDAAGEAVFCQGFEVGVYEGLFRLNQPGSISPVCELPDRFLSDDTFAEAWCLGLVTGYETAFRERIAESVGRDDLSAMERACGTDRWWTLLPYGAGSLAADTGMMVEIGAEALIDITDGFGSVWVTGTVGGVPHLFEIDPRSGMTTAEHQLVPAAADPGFFTVTAGEEYLWVVLRRSVVRIDPATGEAVTVEFGAESGSVASYPVGAAEGGGYVWIALEVLVDGDPFTELYRIGVDDFGSMTDPPFVDLGAWQVNDLLVGADAAVIVLPRGGAEECAVLRIDPEAMVVTSTVPLTGGCASPFASLVAGDDALYVTDSWSGLVRRVGTGGEEDRAYTDGATGMAAFADGVVWVAAGGPPFEVWGYRGSDLEIVAYEAVPDYVFDIGAAGGAVWPIVWPGGTLEETSQLHRMVIASE